MSTSPSVSVLVVTLDGREMLPDCLDGLGEQTLAASDREVVVFDNGSRDRTVEWLRQRTDVRVVAHHENLGFAEANNRAAAEARGHWLVLLNNDARPEPGFLEELVETAERHGAVAAGGTLLDGPGEQVEFGGAGLSWLGLGFQRSSWQPDFAPLSDGAPMPFACGGAMAVRRDAFLAAGGFDADYFAYYEDVDLGWRLNLAGHRIVYAPGARVRHRKHATSSRFSDQWRHRHWFKNILQTAWKDAEDLAATGPAALAVLQSRVGAFHQLAVEARRRGAAGDEARWLEIASGAAEGLVWVLGNLDHVLAKRRAVQQTRTVSDRELHERFGFSADLGPDAADWPESALARRLAVSFAPNGLFRDGATPPAPPRGAEPPVADLARLRHEILALRGSLSWRVTAPARWVADRVRGR